MPVDAKKVATGFLVESNQLEIVTTHWLPLPPSFVESPILLDN